jgi:peptidoglycan-associated lipoprotein
VHFDFDKYNIRPDQMPIVKEVANILKDIKDNYTVRIEGNCDEWGSDEYNYALGLKRAKTVKNALVDLGVDANKLTIISYGESNPVCTEHNRACWAKNRRDNFTLLP